MLLSLNIGGCFFTRVQASPASLAFFLSLALLAFFFATLSSYFFYRLLLNSQFLRDNPYCFSVFADFSLQMISTVKGPGTSPREREKRRDQDTTSHHHPSRQRMKDAAAFHNIILPAREMWRCQLWEIIKIILSPHSFNAFWFAVLPTFNFPAEIIWIIIEERKSE